jgi:hypothetical protein
VVENHASMVPFARPGQAEEFMACANFLIDLDQCPSRLEAADMRYKLRSVDELRVPRQMFQEILRLIAELRPQPPPAPA